MLAGDLHDTQLQEGIIHHANISKIPVIWQGGTHRGCISIRCDGDEEWTYKADRNENGYLGVWILL